MPRTPRDQLFRRSDFDRLVESARRKGLPIQRIDIRRDGLSLIIGEPTKMAPADNNELENWLAKHHAD